MNVSKVMSLNYDIHHTQRSVNPEVMSGGLSSKSQSGFFITIHVILFTIHIILGVYLIKSRLGCHEPSKVDKPTGAAAWQAQRDHKGLLFTAPPRFYSTQQGYLGM